MEALRLERNHQKMYKSMYYKNRIFQSRFASMNFNIFVREIYTYIVGDKKQFVRFICYSSDKHRNAKCRYSQMCFIPSRFQSQLKIFVFGKIQIYIRMRNIGVYTIRLCGPPKLCQAKIRLVPRLHSAHYRFFTLDVRSLIFVARTCLHANCITRNL